MVLKACSEVRLALSLSWLFVVALSNQERAGFLPSAFLCGGFYLNMSFSFINSIYLLQKQFKAEVTSLSESWHHKMTPVPGAGGTEWQLEEAGVALGSISLLLLHAEPQQQQHFSPGKSLSVPEQFPILGEPHKHWLCVNLNFINFEGTFLATVLLY